MSSYAASLMHNDRWQEAAISANVHRCTPAACAELNTCPRTSGAQSGRERLEEWLKHILTVGASSLPFNDVLLNFDEVTCGWAKKTLNEKRR
jgi:hypothetical protein